MPALYIRSDSQETQKFRFPYNAGVLLMHLTKLNKNQHKKTGKLDMFLKKEII